jgi:hypothetical protein
VKTAKHDPACADGVIEYFSQRMLHRAAADDGASTAASTAADDASTAASTAAASTVADEASVDAIQRWAALTPTSYLLPPASYLLPPTSYLLPPTSYLLPPTSYLLPPTSYLLPPTSYLLLRNMCQVEKRGGKVEVSWEEQSDGTLSAVMILGAHVKEAELVRDEILYVARWADNDLAMGSGAQPCTYTYHCMYPMCGPLPCTLSTY